MRIAIIGIGGVGGYFGGKLAQAGHDVTFIARGATLDALRTHGLRVESPLGDFTINPVNVIPTGKFDAILMAVKAWQIPEAAANIKPMLHDDTLVVPLENGIDAPDVLAQILGPQHAVGGLCAIVSYSVAPGHIRHAAAEPMVMFGELDHRRSERVERLRVAFAEAGVRAEVPPDIRRSMWTKFLFIATLSGIGALTRVPIGVWRADPEIRAIVDRSLREVLQLATARGVDLGHDAIERTWERYDGLAPDSTSSMQRDIMDGKPSELDAQLGAIVRLALESGVDVPVSAMIYYALAPQERRARGL
ncbi:MAG TPA: 2-dehydropantoate 2-reductase [Thermoanaerobaculia bacterium]|nr:2-dehydropantoate 2-reductase [Thermoanaerobaculia bacterium]